MPISRPSIDYWYERGSKDGSSFRDSFGPDENTSVAKFTVPWSQRYDAVIALLGYSKLAGTVAAPTALERLTPLKHPDIADAVGGVGHLYVTRVTSITGHGFTTRRTHIDYPGAYFNEFERAELEVQYSQPAYWVMEDGEVTSEYERFTSVESITPSADYLMLPGGVMKYFPSDGLGPTNHTIPFNSGVILPVTELKLKWWNVPYDLFAPLELGPWAKRIFGDGTNLPYLGSVNKTALFDFEPGTVLFSAVEIMPRRSPFTGLAHDITFTLAVDVHGWNFKFYVDTSGTHSAYSNKWHFVARSGSSYQAPGSLTDHTSIYNERELADLWKVTA